MNRIQYSRKIDRARPEINPQARDFPWPKGKKIAPVTQPSSLAHRRRRWLEVLEEEGQGQGRRVQHHRGWHRLQHHGLAASDDRRHPHLDRRQAALAHAHAEARQREPRHRRGGRPGPSRGRGQRGRQDSRGRPGPAEKAEPWHRGRPRHRVAQAGPARHRRQPRPGLPRLGGRPHGGWRLLGPAESKAPRPGPGALRWRSARTRSVYKV